MRHEIDRRTICGEDTVRCKAFDKIYKKVERGMFVFVDLDYSLSVSLSPKAESKKLRRRHDDRKRNLEKTQNLEVIIV